MQTLKIHLNYDTIVNMLLAISFCSFTIFSTDIRGRYIMLACMITILCMDCMKYKFKYRLTVNYAVCWILFLGSYTMFSSIWAESAPDAMEKGKTLMEILAFFWVSYNHYKNKETGVSDIIKVIKWSGFIIVLYSLWFYDIEELISSVSNNTRIENSFVNVNIIGMLASISILIQLNETLKKKKLDIGVLLCFPSVFLLSATYSRKAFVMLVLGIVMILFLHTIDERDMQKKLLRLFGSIVIFAIVVYLILSLPLFAGIVKRMESLIKSFLGTGGKTDSSVSIRTAMIQLGWEIFQESPLVGIGIGNPHLRAARYLNYDAYLHNNFIELLAGGGMIGFVGYYSIYVYLLVKFWKYRHHKNEEYNICLVIMTLFLAMDYGRVSYYSKMTYVFLLLYCLEAEKLKKGCVQAYEFKKHCSQGTEISTGCDISKDNPGECRMV